jgi:hypothetical protein
LGGPDLNRVTRQIQGLLLVILMSTALLGVQLVQGSSLHSHEQHTVDCALCHFQLSDDTEFNHPVALPEQVTTFAATHPETTRITTRAILPYHSRAPPSLSC